MQTTATARRTSAPVPLLAVREARGLSQETVAEAVGIDRSHLSRIERGLARPSLPVLVRLAEVLGLREMRRMLAPYKDVRDA